MPNRTDHLLTLLRDALKPAPAPITLRDAWTARLERSASEALHYSDYTMVIPVDEVVDLILDAGVTIPPEAPNGR